MEAKHLQNFLNNPRILFLGVLSPGTGSNPNPLQRYVDDVLRENTFEMVDGCFTTTIINFNVQDDFNINQLGWTTINSSITEGMLKFSFIEINKHLYGNIKYRNVVQTFQDPIRCYNISNVYGIDI